MLDLVCTLSANNRHSVGITHTVHVFIIAVYFIVLQIIIRCIITLLTIICCATCVHTNYQY